MRIQYAISMDDFRALQVPFATGARTKAAFKAAIAASAAITALGVYCLIRGLGLQLATLLIALGVFAAFVSRAYQRRSVGLAKERYEGNVLAAYQRLHCRDRRTVEFDNDGFTLVCKCGAVKRPWAELVQFSESEQFFQLRTRFEAVVLPKAAFCTEGERTELRRLAVEQINSSLTVAWRSIQVLCTASDYWNSRLLHILRGGGWRFLVRSSLLLAGVGCVVACFFLQAPPLSTPEEIAAIALAVAFLLVTSAIGVFIRGNKPKAWNRIPLRMQFGEEGVLLQDNVAISRNPWDSFCGYLENSSLFLLYHNARLYRIIPRRALGAYGQRFRELLVRKVSPFDYRNPIRLGAPQVSNRS
jgi:membrane protein implicated in regulation of membrane protease activity